MVIYYNPHFPAFTSLFILKGTVISSTLISGEFWFHVGLHSFLAVWFNQKREDYYLEHYKLPTDGFKLTLTLNTFLLVYFSSQCYNRYWAIYNSTQTIDESLKLFVRELDTFLWQKSIRRHVKTAIKYMLSAIFLFYFTLSDGGKIDEEEWHFMKDRGLLTDEEIEFVRGPRCAAIKGVVLTSWAVRCAQTAMRTDELRKLFTPPECAALMNRIDGEAVNCTQSMRDISDLLALPVPYAYFHLLSFVMVCNFIIGNWYLVFTFHTPWTIVPYSAAVLVFLGLRSVSASLADPFRPESSDTLQCAMPSLAFLNNAYHNAVALIETIEDGHPAPEPRCDFDEAWMKADLAAAQEKDEHKIEQAPTVSQLQRREFLENWHHRLCVGEQSHVAFQWKCSQVGAYVEGWLKKIRAKYDRLQTEAGKELEDSPAAHSASAGATAAAEKEEEEEKLTPEQIQIMAAITKLADQQRALFTVVNHLLGNVDQEEDSIVDTSAEGEEPQQPLLQTQTRSEPAKAKKPGAKPGSKPAAKRLGKPNPAG